jgi:hypothetical protein
MDNCSLNEPSNHDKAALVGGLKETASARLAGSNRTALKGWSMV